MLNLKPHAFAQGRYIIVRPGTEPEIQRIVAVARRVPSEGTSRSAYDLYPFNVVPESPFEHFAGSLADLKRFLKSVHSVIGADGRISLVKDVHSLDKDPDDDTQLDSGATIRREQLLDLLTTAATIGFGIERRQGLVRGDLTKELLTYPAIQKALDAVV